MADLSGTVTSGGAAQAVAAFDPARRAFIFQNASDDDLWVRFGGTAAAASPSFLVPAGEMLTLGEGFRSLVTLPISVFGATTGQAFTAQTGGV